MSSLAHHLAAPAPALAAATVLVSAPADAGAPDPWSRAGERGEAIAIDPATQRAIITGADGTSRPLRDGVHRLEDGRTLIIRSGVVVQDADMSASKHEPMRIEEYSVPDPEPGAIVVKTNPASPQQAIAQ